jgi:hypothetical protein
MRRADKIRDATPWGKFKAHYEVHTYLPIYA